MGPSPPPQLEDIPAIGPEDMGAGPSSPADRLGVSQGWPLELKAWDRQLSDTWIINTQHKALLTPGHRDSVWTLWRQESFWIFI